MIIYILTFLFIVAMLSDGQGFAKPLGYAGKGAEGKGQGRDN